MLVSYRLIDIHGKPTTEFLRDSLVGAFAQDAAGSPATGGFDFRRTKAAYEPIVINAEHLHLEIPETISDRLAAEFRAMELLNRHVDK